MTRFSAVKLPAAAAILLLGVTGCTGGQIGGGDDGGNANSIRYLVEQPEDAASLDLLREHLGDFEDDNPGITVELEALPLENMRTVLQTQLRSGEGPDVFSWGSGPGYAGSLAEAGLLYDLTDAYEEYDWPIYEFAKERVTFDGKIVGVPGEMETVGLFYNIDMFADLGIEPPQDLGDLDQAIAAIAESGVTPMAASDQEGWQGGHYLSMALSSEVGGEGMNALLAGEQPWNSPEVVSALKVWEDYNTDGVLPPFPTSLSYDGGSALFYSGDAAMVPTGSWLVDTIQENVDFEVGYIPFPSSDGPGIFTGGLGSGPLISGSTTKTEAALTFVDWLVSPEHGQWTVENLGAIPPYPVESADLDVTPLFRQVLDDTATFSDGSTDFGFNIDVQATDVFNQAMWDGMQAIFSGQKTAEQVAEDLDAAAQAG